MSGFGLVGHALGIARESHTGLEIEIQNLPLLQGALELAEESEAGGLKSNRKHFSPLVECRGAIDPARLTLVYDPQTSGGLLLSLPEDRAESLLLELKDARRIGRVTAEDRGKIILLA